MPAPFSTRLARDDDHATFARFFAELGVPEAPPPFERWRSLMAPTSFFLERDGVPVGYAWYELFGGDGYVRHVVADPSVRRAGVGRALMRELARRFRAAGCSRWRLNVKSENSAAITLYRACGMEVEYPTAVLRLPWSSLASLPRPANTIEARDAAPDRDARLEAAFGLPSGRLASARTLAGARVLELVDHHDASNPKVGVACFDPAFPGCFPFKVARPEFARALLAELRASSPSEVPWIQLVVEDDVPLAKLFVARGGTLLFEVLHFSGELPSEPELSA
ncbi:MAG: GNAT family N-acetyltransferase [Planctomycetes bacterium]|nr:GNAT family N-acetyltransferase [Planctomycetota bacterium]